MRVLRDALQENKQTRLMYFSCEAFDITRDVTLVDKQARRPSYPLLLPCYGHIASLATKGPPDRNL